MCGIVGYVGKRPAVNVLVNGLKKLEYRGYDSAGVAVCGDTGLKVVKCKGRIAELEQRLKDEAPVGRVGIGHTRWATHGEPNEINSHPHISGSGKIAVVHNGIIENYIKLKSFLQAKGYKFISETDTEVIAHLVDYYYTGDLTEAVTKAVNELEGSYALGVICNSWPSRFVAARKDSPLVVGIGQGENFIASDIPAILEYTRDVYVLDDREIAVIDDSEVRIFNKFGMEVKKNILHVDWDVDAAEKSGYEHFMIKEICEEPKVLKDLAGSRIEGGRVTLENIGISAEQLEKTDRIFIVACGTAYHAGVVGKYVIEKLAGIPVEVDIASEFRYRDPIISSKSLVIVISQSGETLDTLVALKESRKKGSTVLAIVNAVGSSIARESDHVLYTWAGPEIAVASTKAYNAQLTALYFIALDFAFKKGTIDSAPLEKYTQAIQNLPDAMTGILTSRDEIQRFASRHYNARSIFFIGRGLDYALSMEGSLKLKEISYIHSEAYAGGELKHGTIALIEEGTLVVCPITQDSLVDKMISNIREVKTRGAVIMAVTLESTAHKLEGIADAIITIPDIDPFIAPIAAITPLQLFAYYMAVEKGCDVDKPRNLAKSVTVE